MTSTYLFTLLSEKSMSAMLGEVTAVSTHISKEMSRYSNRTIKSKRKWNRLNRFESELFHDKRCYDTFTVFQFS